MPSLLGTDSGSGVNVAANYGRMTAQQTYGVGQAFTNFATRQLRLIKITATGSNGSTPVNFTDASAGALSDFSKAVRALQTVAEVYAILTPGTAGFLALVAEDTINDSDTGSNVAGGYGDVEAAILAALAKGGSATATVATADVTATGIAIA